MSSTFPRLNTDMMATANRRPPTHHTQLLRKVILYKIGSELVQDQRERLLRELRHQQNTGKTGLNRNSPVLLLTLYD